MTGRDEAGGSRRSPTLNRDKEPCAVTCDVSKRDGVCDIRAATKPTPMSAISKGIRLSKWDVR